MSILIAFVVKPMIAALSCVLILITVFTAACIIAAVVQAVYEFFFCEKREVLTPTGIPMDNLVEIHVFNKKSGKLVRVMSVDNSMYQ